MAPPNDYSAAHIVVRSFEETIRLLPHMFFGRQRSDPALASAVLSTVLRDTLGPDREAAPDLVVELIIESDHRFTLTDNLVNDMDKLDANGWPLRRWTIGALVAVSAHAAIEIRTADRQWLREFTGPTLTDSRDHEPIGTPGTRITCDLDRDYFAARAALPRAEDLLDTPDDRVTILDLRP
ncbi:hypothetical protein [Nocardia canadensis]|uniref:hypothetical protein n=1 Tax=Nocardia canadensis TaxID=3065238 RepID=UPI00293193F3|nr:hypothetical protein [Nocardia canadensis]